MQKKWLEGVKDEEEAHKRAEELLAAEALEKSQQAKKKEKRAKAKCDPLPTL